MPIAAQPGAHHDEGEGEGEPSHSNADLDPALWKTFPHELLEKVLLCLPLVSLARFRSVCRAWNHAVFDPNFIRTRALTSPQKPWIVITSTSNSISLYDTGKHPPPHSPFHCHHPFHGFTNLWRHDCQVWRHG
jgi:hypothetical protein